MSGVTRLERPRLQLSSSARAGLVLLAVALARALRSFTRSSRSMPSRRSSPRGRCCCQVAFWAAIAVLSGACSDRLIHTVTRAEVDGTDAAPLTSTQDHLVLGDADSETTHQLTQTDTEVITGGLGQSARRLLPRSTGGVYGGELSFVMRIDPGRQNYVTVKLWGSDAPSEPSRLFLYCDGRQVGYRNHGDHPVLHEFSEQAPLPGRFIYVTEMLPLGLTLGRESVALQLVSTGRIAPYAQSSYETYQRDMAAPSGGVYRVYTHLDAYLDPSTEPQGRPPPGSVRPRTGEAEALSRIREHVDGTLAAWLGRTVLSPHEVLVVAMAHGTQWSTLFRNPAAVDKVIEQIDAAALSLDQDPQRFAGGLGAPAPLGGAFDPFYPELSAAFEQLKGAGPLGAAVDLLYPELAPRLDDTLRGSANSTPVARREAWASLLAATRDQLRTTSRGQLLAEHQLPVDTAIYQANRGLARLAPEQAFSEAAARRYLYEAAGVLPALGNDTELGSARPFGHEYSMFSRRGLALSLGYASAHGELVDRLLYLWELTGDAELRARALLSARARAFFRYPSVDSESHRAMRLEGVIGSRSSEYPGPVVYGGRRAELAAAAALQEPDLVAFAQQGLADNQVLDHVEPLAEATHIERLLDFPEQYAFIAAQPPNPHRLPMSGGEPDAVFSDEDAGVVAIRRGEDILYAALFYRAPAVTGVARLHHVRPEMERIATLEVDVQFETNGEVWTRPDAIDWMPGGSTFEPPNPPRQAFAGHRALLARAPAAAKDTRPFAGKASFYRLHYGGYLIGMNLSNERSYELRLPVGVKTAADVVSTRPIRGSTGVPPRSTVVLHSSAGADLRPRPFAPRVVSAVRRELDIALDWDPVSGAASYEVARSVSAGGPYTTLASRVVESGFEDGTIVDSAIYYYVVTAQNAYGQSLPSPEIAVGPSAPAR